MANATEQRKKITDETMAKLEEAMQAIYPEIFFTGDNTSTITFVAGQVNGEDVYGSIKFTLHKANYDIEKEVNKYFAKLEEKELREKVNAQKKADNERKAALQRAKAEKRAEKAELEQKKIEDSIASLKAQLK